MAGPQMEVSALGEHQRQHLDVGSTLNGQTAGKSATSSAPGDGPEGSQTATQTRHRFIGLTFFTSALLGFLPIEKLFRRQYRDQTATPAAHPATQLQDTPQDTPAEPQTDQTPGRGALSIAPSSLTPSAIQVSISPDGQPLTDLSITPPQDHDTALQEAQPHQGIGRDAYQGRRDPEPGFHQPVDDQGEDAGGRSLNKSTANITQTESVRHFRRSELKRQLRQQVGSTSTPLASKPTPPASEAPLVSRLSSRGSRLWNLAKQQAQHEGLTSTSTEAALPAPQQPVDQGPGVQDMTDAHPNQPSSNNPTSTRFAGAYLSQRRLTQSPPPSLTTSLSCRMEQAAMEMEGAMEVTQRQHPDPDTAGDGDDASYRDEEDEDSPVTRVLKMLQQQDDADAAGPEVDMQDASPDSAPGGGGDRAGAMQAAAGDQPSPPLPYSCATALDRVSALLTDLGANLAPAGGPLDLDMDMDLKGLLHDGSGVGYPNKKLCTRLVDPEPLPGEPQEISPELELTDVGGRKRKVRFLEPEDDQQQEGEQEEDGLLVEVAAPGHQHKAIKSSRSSNSTPNPNTTNNNPSMARTSLGISPRFGPGAFIRPSLLVDGWPSGHGGGYSDEGPGVVITRRLCHKEGLARRMNLHLPMDVFESEESTVQELREAYLNAQLVECWRRGECWARLDLAGMELEDTEKHKDRAVELSALLAMHQGVAGVKALLSRIKLEWDLLKTMRQKYGVVHSTSHAAGTAGTATTSSMADANPSQVSGAGPKKGILKRPHALSPSSHPAPDQEGPGDPSLELEAFEKILLDAAAARTEGGTFPPALPSPLVAAPGGGMGMAVDDGGSGGLMMSKEFIPGPAPSRGAKMLLGVLSSLPAASVGDAAQDEQQQPEVVVPPRPAAVPAGREMGPGQTTKQGKASSSSSRGQRLLQALQAPMAAAAARLFVEPLSETALGHDQ